MNLQAKICGLNTPEVVDAAVRGGADAIGFVFYPPSPRSISPETAGGLARQAGRATRVGLFVDPDDGWLDAVLSDAALEMIQLHGSETPQRAAAIGSRTGLPVMKAIRIRGPEDFGAVDAYDGAADWLLFDAKPPKGQGRGLPGGNGVAFDWRLLAGRKWNRPWMLSGGLDAENVAEAVRISGAAWVDVSSGVESAPGTKDPARIAKFLDAVKSL